MSEKTLSQYGLHQGLKHVQVRAIIIQSYHCKTSVVNY